jgi:DNA-binding XRE family transcriptional regulator
MNSTKALKSLRGKKMKTQQEVADSLGISRQIYNSYENDTIKCELDLIFKILDSLDATDLEVDEFLCGLKQDYMSYSKKIKSPTN